MKFNLHLTIRSLLRKEDKILTSFDYGFRGLESSKCYKIIGKICNNYQYFWVSLKKYKQYNFLLLLVFFLQLATFYKPY